MKNTMIFFFFTMMFVGGCSDNSTNNPDNTVSDTVFTDPRDGKKYDIVKINSQVWMSENLNASTYRNGDPIRYARTPEEWVDAAEKKEGAWCYYDNDPKNGEVYGKLYNWYAVNDSRGLAPKGYHIPSNAEWTILTDMLGGEDIGGQKMKSKSGWTGGGNGSNSSGFNGLPGGYCNYYGNFRNVSEFGYFWSSSDDGINNAWFRNLFSGNTKVSSFDFDKWYGLSLRCLKD
ncbi:MAG: FISUMP domain-containing protein [Bacteroidota bacterium]